MKVPAREYSFKKTFLKNRHKYHNHLSTYRHDNTYHILLGLCNVHVKENDKVCFDILFLRM